MFALQFYMIFIIISEQMAGKMLIKFHHNNPNRYNSLFISLQCDNLRAKLKKINNGLRFVRVVVTEFEIGWEAEEIFFSAGNRWRRLTTSNKIKHLDVLISMNNIFSSRLLHIPQRHALLL